jgi:hypothetical protein
MGAAAGEECDKDNERGIKGEKSGGERGKHKEKSKIEKGIEKINEQSVL